MQRVKIYQGGEAPYEVEAEKVGLANDATHGRPLELFTQGVPVRSIAVVNITHVDAVLVQEVDE